MHAVGDAADGVVDDGRPGLVGDATVQLADAVGAARIAQREGGHVELAGVAVDAEAHLQDAARTSMPDALSIGRGQLAHQVGGEALVPGRYRGVDGEDGPGANLRERVVERGSLGHQLARLLHEHERGVALVEVPGRRGDAQLAQGADAADAEDELLVQPHLATAHVEDVADGPVALGVLGDVGVEQQQGYAADLYQPHRGVNGAPGQLHARPSAARPAGRSTRSSGRRAGSRLK